MMQKIKNVVELQALPTGYVWAWSFFDGEYAIWQWTGDGLAEMYPSEMAAYNRLESISDDMFPMYVIPEPPEKPGVIEGFVQAFNQQAAIAPAVANPTIDPAFKDIGYVSE